jgi:dTDP-4-amino-4,6-dideoxygalactose transaminase
MPAHLYGHPCDMNATSKIAKEYNLHIVEYRPETFGIALSLYLEDGNSKEL